MNGLVLLPAIGHRRMRWANGSGATSEIMVSPPGAGMHNFLWRASIADIDRPGPFSPLPGIDRSIMVLDGLLRLRIDAMAPIRLAPDTPPFSFSGDAAVFAQPEGRPVADFSMMTRRGQASARVQVVGGRIPCRHGEMLLLAIEPTTLEMDGRQITLCQRDCAYLPKGPERDVFASRPIICAEMTRPIRG